MITNSNVANIVDIDHSPNEAHCKHALIRKMQQVTHQVGRTLMTTDDGQNKNEERFEINILMLTT